MPVHYEYEVLRGIFSEDNERTPHSICVIIGEMHVVLSFLSKWRRLQFMTTSDIKWFAI